MFCPVTLDHLRIETKHDTEENLVQKRDFVLVRKNKGTVMSQRDQKVLNVFLL